MAAPKRSTIGWTDYSGGDLNFVIGCTRVSPGCKNCYGFRWAERWGKDFSTVRIYPDKLERLRTWQPKPPFKRGPSSRPMAFVVDMGDLFHEKMRGDTIQDFLDIVFLRQDIDWQILTKRSGRMQDEILCWRHNVCLPDLSVDPLPNLWLGVSVESPDYLWRVDDLLKTPAAVRFVSLEPMLGPVDLHRWLICHACGGTGAWADVPDCPVCLGTGSAGQIHLVIVGAESGPNRRPFRKEWAWDVLDQCRAAGVPFYGKQGSGVRPGVPLLDRDGGECKEWPVASC